MIEGALGEENAPRGVQTFFKGGRHQDFAGSRPERSAAQQKRTPGMTSLALDSRVLRRRSLGFLQPAEHSAEILADIFNRVLGFAAAHSGKASVTGLILQHKFAGKLAGLNFF